MTDRPALKVGDRVVDGCPKHRGEEGEVIDCYGEPPRQRFRIRFADGRRCWPLNYEKVTDDNG